MLDLKNIQLNINRISEERGLKPEQVLLAFEAALAAAYKKAYRKKEEMVRATIDLRTGKTEFWLVKIVIEQTENLDREITLEEARVIKADAQIGEELLFAVEIKEEFTRIAAMTAKQVILHQLREFEKDNAYEDFREKQGKIVWGIVQRLEKAGIIADLGRTTGTMFFREAIPNERYRVGQRLRFYVYAVEKSMRGPQIYLSRAHPDFLKVLFETEVPEITEGIIEIKVVARDPGVRSKMAVISKKPSVDAIGACVGPKGSRILTITNELNGEKIDIIIWSDDPVQFVKNSLSPAKVEGVEIFPRRNVRVLVSDEQIPLAIGKNGQNVKLAAKLTSWRIDVRSAVTPEMVQEHGVAELEPLADAEGEAQEVSIEGVASENVALPQDEVQKL